MAFFEHWLVGLSAFWKLKTGSVIDPFFRRLTHGLSDVLNRQTESSEVLLFGFDLLRMEFVNFLEKFDFFPLKIVELFFLVLFLFSNFHNVLCLLEVQIANFLFPVLHVPFLRLLGIFSDLFLFLFLMRQELPIHFLYFFTVLIWYVFQLSCVI
jgi:hypothetical protein